MSTKMLENNCETDEQKLVFDRQPLSRQRSLPATRYNNNKDDRHRRHHHHHHKSLSLEELKLAAVAISLNASLRSANMPISMMERAFRYARSFLDSSAASSASHHRPSPRPSPTLLARSIKREFDSLYGPAWHCVVGKSFGSFVSHSPGGFVYFSVDSFSFLLFKTEVQLVKDY